MLNHYLIFTIYIYLTQLNIAFYRILINMIDFRTHVAQPFNLHTLVKKPQCIMLCVMIWFTLYPIFTEHAQQKQREPFNQMCLYNCITIYYNFIIIFLLKLRLYLKTPFCCGDGMVDLLPKRIVVDLRVIRQYQGQLLSLMYDI